MSPNSTIAGVSFLVVCISNFVFKTRRFSDIQLQGCRDLEICSKVIESGAVRYVIESGTVHLLLVSYRNFVPKKHRFRDSTSNMM